MPDVKPVKTQSPAKAATSKLAIMSYLDEMLHEATTSAEQAASEEPIAEIAEEAPLSIPRVAAPLQPQQTPEPTPQPQPDENTATTTAPPAAAPEPAVSAATWLANGRPSWAQEAFDCLVFSVQGLKLAVPMILLGSIHRLDKEMTPLFDQPSWFLGLLPVQQEQNLRIVDTTQLIMPERYDPQQAAPVNFAIGVYNSDWAFAADSIEGSLTIAPEAVKWRSQRTRRPWLAGTLISEMCALIDLDAFAGLLAGE